MPRNEAHPDGSLQMQINRVMLSVMQITDRLTDYNQDLEPGQVEDTQNFDLRATPDYNTNSDFGEYPENSDQEIGGSRRHRRFPRHGVHSSVLNRVVSLRPPAARLPGYRVVFQRLGSARLGSARAGLVTLWLAQPN
ncbi:hypothetical protein K435DRAFT_865856 [Dendrothele bispora CBS 962.96]|uniref:Uncharacterized protein n=1 Tax=Dendrothele bispora (strain CBS 962.96) TaxID=1314807 RepID=A0A4S8LIE4_DENBC|nr:hypothetical protein K435DRAFT_865856 [Dendrothele bispora CBS 962.96]